MNRTQMIQALLAGGGMGQMPGTMPYAPVGGSRTQRIRAMQRSGMLPPHERDWEQWAGGMGGGAAPAPAAPPPAAVPPQIQEMIAGMLGGAGGGMAQGAGMLSQGVGSLGSMFGGMFGGAGVGQPVASPPPPPPTPSAPPMVTPNPQAQSPPAFRAPPGPMGFASDQGAQQMLAGIQGQNAQQETSAQDQQQQESARQQEMLRQANEFIAQKMQERIFREQQQKEQKQAPSQTREPYRAPSRQDPRASVGVDMGATGEITSEIMRLLGDPQAYREWAAGFRQR